MVDVDDKMMDNAQKSVPRADVAELCVQALQLPEYRNRWAVSLLLLFVPAAVLLCCA